MLSIEDMIKEREKQRIRDASMDAAKSGGLSASLISGAGELLSGTRSLPKILGKAALTGLGAGALTGGATYLGSQLMGAPDEGEPGGFTNRALIGGALAGGALGAGAGALLGSGKLQWLSRMPKVAESLREPGMFNNLFTDQVKKLAKSGPGRTAAALGLGGVALGGAMGANEGTAVDYLDSLKDEEDRRRGYS